eukprot:TRINITY_DN46981_c0_g1_i1.p1 TRINITY_DN46981_c0_g1~~TRINITY_DN46981_c0_g1_i1.p1  ORF type:complete len:1451 (+),score=406.31 TRINITY_DN46981_c0_g1_i1:75-4427(+)
MQPRRRKNPRVSSKIRPSDRGGAAALLGSGYRTHRPKTATEWVRMLAQEEAKGLGPGSDSEDYYYRSWSFPDPLPVDAQARQKSARRCGKRSPAAGSGARPERWREVGSPHSPPTVRCGVPGSPIYHSSSPRDDASDGDGDQRPPRPRSALACMPQRASSALGMMPQRPATALGGERVAPTAHWGPFAVPASAGQPRPPQGPPAPSRLRLRMGDYADGRSASPKSRTGWGPARRAEDTALPEADVDTIPEDPEEAFAQVYEKARRLAAGPRRGSDLTEKGAEVIFDHWVLSYLYDLGTGVPLGGWYQTVLKQLGLLTEEGPCMRRLRVATYFLVLERAAAHIGRIGSAVLRMLAREVYRGDPKDPVDLEAEEEVLMSPRTRARRRSSEVTDASSPRRGTRRGSEVAAPPPRSAVPKLSMPLWKDLYDGAIQRIQHLEGRLLGHQQVAEQRFAEANAQRRAMARALMYYCFSAWRGGRRRARTSHLLAIARSAQIRSRHLVRRAFMLWRCDALECRCERRAMDLQRVSEKELALMRIKSQANEHRFEQALASSQEELRNTQVQLEAAHKQVQQMERWQDDLMKQSQGQMAKQFNQLRVQEEKQAKQLANTQRSLEKTLETSAKAQAGARKILAVFASRRTAASVNVSASGATTTSLSVGPDKAERPQNEKKEGKEKDAGKQKDKEKQKVEEPDGGGDENEGGGAGEKKGGGADEKKGGDAKAAMEKGTPIVQAVESPSDRQPSVGLLAPGPMPGSALPTTPRQARPAAGDFLSQAKQAVVTASPQRRQSSKAKRASLPAEGGTLVIGTSSADLQPQVDVHGLLTDMNPERTLLFWMRRCLKEMEGDFARNLNNFTTDLQDGENLCVLGMYCFPDHFSIDLKKVVNPRKRITKLLNALHTPLMNGGIGMPQVVTPGDVTQGLAPANLLLCSMMLEKWVEHCPAEELDPAEPDERRSTAERISAGSAEGGSEDDDEVEQILATFQRIRSSNESWAEVVTHVRAHVTSVLLHLAKGAGSKAAITDDTVNRDRDLYVCLRRERCRDVVAGGRRQSRVTGLAPPLKGVGSPGGLARSGSFGQKQGKPAARRKSIGAALGSASPTGARRRSSVAVGFEPGDPGAEVTSPQRDAAPASDRELAEVEEVLAKHFEELRKIYKFYSRLSPKSQEMTSQEFMRFVSDCNLVDNKTLSQAGIDVMFTRVNWTEPDESTARKKQDGSTRELSPIEFVEMIVRIAGQKYPGKVPARVQREPETTRAASPASAFCADDEADVAAGKEGAQEDVDGMAEQEVRMSDSLADRVNHLIVKDILPRASLSEVDNFKALVYSPSLQNVINDHQVSLYRIFMHFSAGDKSNPNSATMNFKEFQQLVGDARLVGESLTKLDVAFVFSNAQSDDDNQGDEEMVYREFVEALVAIAFFKNPNIMLPPATRLRNFLVKQLFPAISAVAPKLKLKV